MFNKALNNMRFIYFYCTNAIREFQEKQYKNQEKSRIMTQKSSFFIAGRHAVISALKNPKRRVLKIFLTEDSKKNIHKLNPNKNLLLTAFFSLLTAFFSFLIFGAGKGNRTLTSSLEGQRSTIELHPQHPSILRVVKKYY